MSPADNYKRNEVKVVENIIKVLSVIINSIHAFFKFLIQKGKQRFTVMFIPHSEKKILNFLEVTNSSYELRPRNIKQSRGAIKERISNFQELTNKVKGTKFEKDLYY